MIFWSVEDDEAQEKANKSFNDALLFQLPTFERITFESVSSSLLN